MKYLIQIIFKFDKYDEMNTVRKVGTKIVDKIFNVIERDHQLLSICAQVLRPLVFRSVFIRASKNY